MKLTKNQKFILQQQEKEQAWSAEQAQKQMDFQREMSNTAHQREIADLQAAGLNPVLSAGGTGASTPSGAMANNDSALNALAAVMMSSARSVGGASRAVQTTAKGLEKLAQKGDIASSGNPGLHGGPEGTFAYDHFGNPPDGFLGLSRENTDQQNTSSYWNFINDVDNSDLVNANRAVYYAWQNFKDAFDPIRISVGGTQRGMSVRAMGSGENVRNLISASTDLLGALNAYRSNFMDYSARTASEWKKRYAADYANLQNALQMLN